MKIKLDKNYKGLIKGKVTKSGNGGHIIVPKKYIGESVDILIEDNSYLSGKNMPDNYYGD
jgi:putative transposon-encoded protein